jgi:hypothetical protein
MAMGLEGKVEKAVYNYNRYNPDHIVHAATYFRLTDCYGNQNIVFLLIFKTGYSSIMKNCLRKPGCTSPKN